MLPVSNSDSTNEVIRLALQQFGIIVSTEEEEPAPVKNWLEMIVALVSIKS